MSNEQFIKGLEQFIADFKPFCGNKEDWKRVYDALDQLKKQEAVKPVINGHEWVCGNCGYPIESCISYNSLIVYEKCHKFCPECGRQVKWE